MNFHAGDFMWTYVFTSFKSICLEVELLRSMVNFLRKDQAKKIQRKYQTIFQSGHINLHFYHTCMRVLDVQLFFLAKTTVVDVQWLDLHFPNKFMMLSTF